MQVILTKDIPNLGKKGAIKSIADGFARNYLIPKGLAVIATPEAVNVAKTQQNQKTASQEKELETIQEIASKIEGHEFILKKKASNGKLFGSVSAKEISSLIRNEGFEVGEKTVAIGEPIKETGEHRITLAFGHGIEISVTVIVEEE
jgi:large subunit ribosomal protein L9